MSFTTAAELAIMRRRRPKELKAPSPPPPPIASPDQKRAALGSHRLLQQSLAVLRKRLAAGTIDVESSSKLLAECQQHSEGLSAYLSTTIEPTYYAELIPPSSSSTHRTLAIPELFELILDFLPIPAILALHQTCKEYKTRIDNSAHVQTRLCLRPAPAGSNFRLPFKKCLLSPGNGKEGFHCRNRTGLESSIDYTDGRKPKLSIEAAFRTPHPVQIVQPMGATYRRMFITQPPITTLTPWTLCCDSTEQFVCEEGITLGNLHTATQDMIEKHKFCPRAPCRNLMPENGENHVGVLWQGEVVLMEDDPKVVKGRPEFEAREQKKRADGLRSRKMREYFKAKRDAHRAGEPIPTMQQWLDANPSWKNEEKSSSNEEDLAMQGTTIANDAFSFN